MNQFVKQQQLTIAEDLSSKLKRGKQRLPASIRTAFVGDPRFSSYLVPADTTAPEQTPLSVLLGTGGGRGGATRLKLYLSMLWTAKQDPYTIRNTNPAVWAYLVGLDAREPAVRRSITRNFHWLTERGFLRLASGGDTGEEFVILEETRRGVDYTPPYVALADHVDDEDERIQHFYFKLPHRFWTDGFIAELDQTEIACLLILLDEVRRRNGPIEEESVWWAESRWQRRYGLSPDTRQKGFGGLMNRGIVRRQKGHLVPSFDVPRGRHPIYVLDDTRFDGRPINDEPPAE